MGEENSYRRTNNVVFTSELLWIEELCRDVFLSVQPETYKIVSKSIDYLKKKATLAVSKRIEDMINPYKPGTHLLVATHLLE